MIGVWSNYAEEFLIGLAGLTFFYFTIPLLFVPLCWAKMMGFEIPSHKGLAVYFGRSVGALAAAINFLALHAGMSGRAIPDVLLLIVAISALMVVIHAWGAFKKIQPLSETVEIGFWILMGLAALAACPAGCGCGRRLSRSLVIGRAEWNDAPIYPTLPLRNSHSPG